MGAAVTVAAAVTMASVVSMIVMSTSVTVLEPAGVTMVVAPHGVGVVWVGLVLGGGVVVLLGHDHILRHIRSCECVAVSD